MKRDKLLEEVTRLYEVAIAKWRMTSEGTLSQTYYDGESNGIDLIKSLIIQLDEPEKVVIPQFVADYLETAKKEISLLRVFEIANGLNELDMWRKEYNWIRLYHLDFARAWLDGYEIEKEPLYFISFPTPNRGNINMWRNTDTGSFYFAKSGNLISQDGYKCAFTEKEIKDYDDRYWQFAELV